MSPPTEREILGQGFQDFPDAAKLSKMSAAELAILLAQRDTPGKAGSILIEHQLKMRLAKEQTVATWRAAGMGAAAALLAAVIGAWSTGAFQPQQTQKCVCEWQPSELRPQENLSVKPPSAVTPEPAMKAVTPSIAPGQSVQPAQASQRASNPKP